MFYILKGLYIEHKVRAYEKAIMALQVSRSKLKAKQLKATKSREKYVVKAAQHKLGEK